MSTSHPALHNFTTDTSECDASPGTTCAVLAACGSSGRFNSAIWLELTISPFGSVTVSGVSAILLSTTGAVDSRKWLEAPESKMAQFRKFSEFNATSRIIDAAA